MDYYYQTERSSMFNVGDLFELKSNTEERFFYDELLVTERESDEFLALEIRRYRRKYSDLSPLVTWSWRKYNENRFEFVRSLSVEEMLTSDIKEIRELGVKVCRI